MDEKNKKKFRRTKIDDYHLKSVWNFVCVFDSIFKFIQKDSYIN